MISGTRQPRRLRLTHLGALAAGLLLACARPGTDDGLPGGDEATLDGVLCVDLCADRLLHEQSDGWCSVAWATPEGADCQTTCEEASAGPLADQQAMSECIETNPLCFETLNQCLGRGTVIGR